MIDAGLNAAFDATWPAAEYARAGGLVVGRGNGGGRRVGSARRHGPVSEDDLAQALALQRDWGQRPQVCVMDDDAELIGFCDRAGLRRHTPAVLMQAPLPALTDRPIPPVTAFAVWPPMAIQRDLWALGDIDAARLAVMARVQGPRAALLGRMSDRAAGVGFVAIHGPVAMVHALVVLPDFRRQGMAGWLMRRAALWAQEKGADRLALAVGRENEGAVALYAAMGFAEVAGYAYYAPT